MYNQQLERERASYNGSIEASQASDVGSIPIARSITHDDSIGLTHLNYLNLAEKWPFLDPKWTPVESIGPWSRRKNRPVRRTNKPDWPVFRAFDSAPAPKPTDQFANLARVGATGADSASWGNFPQPTFSFVFRMPARRPRGILHQYSLFVRYREKSTRSCDHPNYFFIC